MNSIGNVEPKEFICMTHEHDLKRGNVGGKRCAGWRGIKGEKWDNCNSIINKIFFKKYIAKVCLLYTSDAADDC